MRDFSKFTKMELAEVITIILDSKKPISEKTLTELETELKENSKDKVISLFVEYYKYHENNIDPKGLELHLSGVQLKKQTSDSEKPEIEKINELGSLAVLEYTLREKSWQINPNTQKDFYDLNEKILSRVSNGLQELKSEIQDEIEELQRQNKHFWEMYRLMTHSESLIIDQIIDQNIA